MKLIGIVLAATAAIGLAGCNDKQMPVQAVVPAPSVAAATVSATPSASPSATPTVASAPVAAAQPSYRDATYTVNGRPVQLTDGLSEVAAAPGSASKVVTRIFGNTAEGDLNGDGRADIAFILTQSPGGSGTFFYAVAALRTDTGWTGLNAVPLGDRIDPQPTTWQQGSPGLRSA
jgi:hypothetical protein